MTRQLIHRSDLLWLVLLLGAVALHAVVPDFRADVPTDSYRTGPRGKKAFFLLADHLEDGVGRNFRSLGLVARSFRGVESDTVLLLLGPARVPTPREWNELAEFVDAGGAFVFAAPSDAPEFSAEPFDVSGRELEEPLNLESGTDPIQIDLGGLNGTFSWQSRGELLSPNAQQIVVADGSVQAVLQRRGAGVAVFVATDRPFENRTLTWTDNAVLAFRLLEAAGWRGNILFDESLNVSGTPKVVALLLEQPLRSPSFHLLAVLIVFGWWRSRRFGPLQPPSVPVRSDIVAHADAVGMLHYKARDGRTALRHYLRQLSTELKLRRFSRAGGRDDRVLEPIARRLDRPVGEVKAELQSAATALKGAKLDRASAATHIRRLATIRRAAKTGSQLSKSRGH